MCGSTDTIFVNRIVNGSVFSETINVLGPVKMITRTLDYRIEAEADCEDCYCNDVAIFEPIFNWDLRGTRYNTEINPQIFAILIFNMWDMPTQAFIFQMVKDREEMIAI